MYVKYSFELLNEMLFELSDFDFNVDSGHSFVKRIRTSLVPEKKKILIIWKRNQDSIYLSVRKI